MGAKKRSAEINIKIDRKLAAAWRAARAKLAKVSKEGAQDWDARYELIGAILEHEPPLYLAGGYATDADFIDQEVHEDRSNLFRNVRVARFASATDVQAYGPSKLDAAISLLEVQNGGPLKHGAPVDFARLRCTFTDGGQTVTKSFRECSVAQLRSAIALAKGHQATSHKASPAARAIAAVVKKSGAKGVTFSVSKGHVSFRVGLSDVARLGAALAHFEPPPDTGG